MNKRQFNMEDEKMKFEMNNKKENIEKDYYLLKKQIKIQIEKEN